MKGRLVETRRHALVRQVLVLLRHTFHNSQHSAHAVYILFYNHNVYFVKYNVTVSFVAQVLDTVTYFVSHVLDSGYSDIFWHIL